MTSASRRYWRFFWPLGFMAIAVFSGRLVQNYVLLQYEEGVRELAVYALAMAFFGPFRGVMAFAPQMANVLVRGPRSFRATLRFVMSLAVLCTALLAVVAWTPLGGRIMPIIYNMPSRDIDLILVYLRYFTPLILLTGACFYFEGLLVQAHRTGIVSALRIGSLLLAVCVLAVGLYGGWSPVFTLSLSLILPVAVHTVVGGLMLLKYRVRHSGEEDRRLTQREVARFYLPMVATTIMFTLTRPIIFAFLTVSAQRSGGAVSAEAMVAGVSLAFNVNMLFQSTVNQFRNLSVTFGTENLPALRRFMVRITAGVFLLMALVVLTPVARLFLRHLQGAEGAPLAMACQSLYVLLLVPIVIGWRNYHHGLAMVRKRTAAMAAGAMSRNLSILPLGAALLALGWYNHIAAAAMLVVGFASEATTVVLFRKFAPRRP